MTQEQYLPGTMSQLIALQAHKQSVAIDEKIEQMLIAQFGSLAEAMKQKATFDIQFDAPNLAVLNEATFDGPDQSNDVVFRYEQSIRIVPKGTNTQIITTDNLPPYFDGSPS